ncbi:MAG TPA: glycosyltransferase [Anaerolineae bacterium]|nr:glycosyltransferase [Anaerolineae bacterium]
MHKTKPYLNYQKKHADHWDSIAQKQDQWKSWGGYYRKRLQQIHQFLVPPSMKVLEVGCGRGDLLASLKPSKGVGIDLSGEMVNRARKRNPEITFQQADLHELELDKKFDFIIMSDLINELWDVEWAFKNIAKISYPSTRVILNYFSRFWELPLNLAKTLGTATPTLTQNWLSVEDVNNLLYLAGFEVIRNWGEVLCPLPIPFLAPFCNRYLVRLWPFRFLAMTGFTLARPIPRGNHKQKKYSVSVIVPARNEEGNIPAIFERMPEMGKGTEVIFIEGHSRDNTYQVIEKNIKKHPHKKSALFHQKGIGKGDAVRLGFSKATGDILMIMDADLTVPPEDLPRFYHALVSGKGELINGVRLVYPMEKRAMRFLNLIGNKAFSIIFTYLLGQPIKDSLCGTKVLWKTDYERIAASRAYFGDFDPFGDFDLIFGAAKLNLKIVDMPIRYHERVYGTTNIQRWKHGLLLLRMVLFAARRLKFI